MTLIQPQQSSLGFFLSFAPPLEQDYLSATHVRRTNAFVLSILIALAIYNVFLVSDWLNRPEILPHLAWVRLLWTTVPCLLLTVVIWKTPNTGLQELCVSLGVVITTTSIVYITAMTQGSFASADLMTYPLVIVVMNTMLPLRFPVSVVVTILIFCIFVFSLLIHPDIGQEFQSMAVVVLMAASVYTLSVTHRIELQERRAFLHELQEKQRRAEIDRMNGELYRLSRTDPLTGVFNRRYFDEQSGMILGEAARSGEKVAILLFDVDRFKLYNDSLGHPQGDVCLKAIARIAGESLAGNNAVFARIGGEEFSALLRGTDEQAAIDTANRIRMAIMAAAMPHGLNEPSGVVTISIGVATVSQAGSDTIADVMKRADDALYRAKKNGRNRVEAQGIAQAA